MKLLTFLRIGRKKKISLPSVILFVSPFSVVWYFNTFCVLKYSIFFSWHRHFSHTLHLAEQMKKTNKYLNMKHHFPKI